MRESHPKRNPFRVTLRYQDGTVLSPGMIPTVLCLPLGVLAAVVARFAVDLPFVHYARYLQDYPELSELFPAGAIPAILLSLSLVCGLCAGLLAGTLRSLGQQQR